MQFFDDLGSLVEQRWRAANYNEEAFPDVAARALVETSASEQVDAWDIIRRLSSATHLPIQSDIDAKFGNPPVTLFNGPRFHIDVYYWLDGTTAIHQHAFSGAFQVLAGSSIHSRYRFAREEKISDHFAFGQVIYDGVELLKKGDVRRILPGEKFIHALFHLDRPSATICVRTHQTVSALPQFSYLKPYFAIDPFFKDEPAIRKVQSASLLLKMNHPEADSMIEEMIASSDFQTAFALLETTFRHLTGDEIERIFRLSAGRDRFRALVEKARRRHGQLVDFALPVLDHSQQQANIVTRRAYMTANEHRFFLALILNVPERRLILDLVRERFPHADPAGKIAAWVSELSTMKLIGSTDPNIIGVDFFDDACELALRRLLDGFSLEQVKSEFEKKYPGAEEGELKEIIDSFHNSILLRPLVFDSARERAEMKGGN